ncbi:MAG: diaminopimelate decarboxylase [Deltaproteobacteria bacterium]|nr:diaminopimelate decarboxylase [Deltaproteobacteria bacterium]
MTPDPVWLGPRRARRLAERFGTPLFVYSRRLLRGRCRALQRAFPGAELHYAMKANSNPSLLRLFTRWGLGIDAVSPWEVALALAVGADPLKVLFTGNNPSPADLAAVHASGVRVNLDALPTLEAWARLSGPGREVSLRLNLDVGGGHHRHVVTGGRDSKFGLTLAELPEARRIAGAHGHRIVGLHQHIGSGVFDVKLFLAALEPLLALVPDFPDLSFVDAGGGFGVPYRPEERPVDLAAWGHAVLSRVQRAREEHHRPGLRLLLEPGRYVVCEAGVLLSTVTTVKPRGDRVWVGLDTGMHHLVRPALYQAWHPVRSYPRGRRERPTARCWLVGSICESGDVLAEARALPLPEAGELVALGNAGAYGYVMASHYNLRPRPAEVLVDGDRFTLLRAAETFEEVVNPREIARANKMR